MSEKYVAPDGTVWGSEEVYMEAKKEQEVKLVYASEEGKVFAKPLYIPEEPVEKEEEKPKIR